MERKRGGLIPAGEAFGSLGDADPIPGDAVQARRPFTIADQVNQLVWASEADADLGFMARTMALCSLPRSNPGNQLQYKRVNGPFTLYMIAGGDNKLPFGNLPRLLLSWGVYRSSKDRQPRTGSREVALRLHAIPGGLQQQWGKTHPAPQPDAAAVQCSCSIDLQRRVR